MASKRARQSIKPTATPAGQPAAGAVSHEEVMQALRRRCGESSSGSAHAASSHDPQAVSPKPTSAASRSSANPPKRSVAAAAAALRSMSPTEVKPIAPAPPAAGSRARSPIVTPVSPVIARQHNSLQMLLNASVVAEEQSNGAC